MQQESHRIMVRADPYKCNIGQTAKKPPKMPIDVLRAAWLPDTKDMSDALQDLVENVCKSGQWLTGVFEEAKRKAAIGLHGGRKRKRVDEPSTGSGRQVTEVELTVPLSVDEALLTQAVAQDMRGKYSLADSLGREPLLVKQTPMMLGLVLPIWPMTCEEACTISATGTHPAVKEPSRPSTGDAPTVRPRQDSCDVVDTRGDGSEGKHGVLYDEGTRSLSPVSDDWSPNLWSGDVSEGKHGVLCDEGSRSLSSESDDWSPNLWSGGDDDDSPVQVGDSSSMASDPAVGPSDRSMNELIADLLDQVDKESCLESLLDDDEPWRIAASLCEESSGC